MKIGLFIHSHTGNTLSVAEQLRDKLLKTGHTVELRKLEPVGGENTNEIDINKIRFASEPDVSGYDYIIIGAPVRGFSISPVLAAYMNHVSSLKGQKIDLFVTQAFPYAWMGGNNAIKQMKTACEKKGALIGNTAIVNWKNKRKDALIQELVTLMGNK
ncbi:MAG: flavodoxin/nitric oxide synthase [Herbinix sp.]|jgi:flavodoxin|nr:flavodoxin/nitric oxide synthase [Herbinix sp.]